MTLPIDSFGKAITVPLTVWPDPQGDVVLHYSRGECLIYFGCWLTSEEPANYVGKLIFHYAWAVRGACFEFLPYEIHEHNHPSNICTVENSKWLKEMCSQRLAYYPEWKNWDIREYSHYVISGHDNYYEIIAAGFDEQTVPQEIAGEFVRLIYDD